MTMDQDEIRITTQKQALKRARDLAAAYKPDGALASDQLIAERREDAARDDDGTEASDG